MCRLLGLVSPVPTTPAAVLGTDALQQFGRLAELHGDGWGTAWTSPGTSPDPSATYRSPQPAHLDPTFAELTRSHPVPARIVHLRWATPGLAIVPQNSHPFTSDGMSFAHNGSILPTAAIDELLAPSLAGSLQGSTDSERYFALIRQELRSGGGITEAVARAVVTLRSIFPLVSLNALLLTDAELVVVHVNCRDAVPAASEMARVAVIPPDHGEDYFRLRWRRGDDGTVAVVSTGLPMHGWQTLPENTITRIGLADLTMQVHQLSAAAQGALDEVSR